MPKLVLNYFDARGRAEFARLIAAAGDLSYTDNRIEGKDWPTIKPTTPLGQLPYLEVDNVVLPQSIAIARYFAREANLAGKTNLEQAQADAIVDTCIDAITGYVKKVFPNHDGKPSEEGAKQFLIEDAPKHFCNIEKLIAEYGNDGFAVGKSLTWADLFIYQFISSIELGVKSSITDNNPALTKIKKIVEAHPKAGAYLKSRPAATF